MAMAAISDIFLDFLGGRQGINHVNVTVLLLTVLLQCCNSPLL